MQLSYYFLSNMMLLPKQWTSINAHGIVFQKHFLMSKAALKYRREWKKHIPHVNVLPLLTLMQCVQIVITYDKSRQAKYND